MGMNGIPDRSVAHAAAVARLVAGYAALPPDAPVRLAKRTSNLFRNRPQVAERLEVSELTGVISLDNSSAPPTARVAAMTTYEDLVDELLPHGYMPLVVPQLRTITIGGAVTGLGIESTSFRSGLAHDSVRELEILTGAGEIVTATAGNEHADLFRAFPNSYGSLGYAVSLVIELERVSPWVALRHIRFGGIDALCSAIGEILADRAWDGEPVDFLDGVVFSGTESYLSLGRWAERGAMAPAAGAAQRTSQVESQGRTGPPDLEVRTSDYTGPEPYYRSIQHRRTDLLTVKDYLWRWDTDWFWCSRAFGAQKPRLRRVWPRRWLRSDFYWRIMRLEQRYRPVATLNRLRGRPEEERVIQDVDIPLEATVEFLTWFLEHVPIEPLWVCPLQVGDGGADERHTGAGVPWPLYPMTAGAPYVNVGFWSAVPILPGRRPGDVNRAIEAKVAELGGRKGLYSEAFYDEQSFHSLYGGEVYDKAKARYDPGGRLPTLYDKAVRSR